MPSASSSAPSRACAILCLLALVVVVVVAATDDHPQNSRKSRDAILEEAALRTGKSAGEILGLLSRLAERRGSPEAELPSPLEESETVAFPERRPMVGSSASSSSLDGGMRLPGHSTGMRDDDAHVGGRLDLDRLLRLSGFPGPGGGVPGDQEDSAILDFLEEVARHGSNEAGSGAGDQPAAHDGPLNGNATAEATSRRSRTSVRVPLLPLSPPVSHP